VNNIELLKATLRDHRLKYGTDYAIVFKYGEIRVLCHEAYRYAIEECAKTLGLVVSDWYTYT